MKKSMKNTEKARVIREYVSTIVCSSVICALVLFAALPVSCRLTETGIHLIASDVTAPSVLSFSVTGEKSAVMVFSEPALLDSVAVNEAQCEVTYGGTGETACVAFPEPTEVGTLYTFSCTVSDSAGNTLTYTRPFSGYNASPARLVLSEIRTETSGNNEKYPEFIELYVLTGGNLWGLSLVTAKGGSEKTYNFAAVQVSAGEFITVHYMSPQDGLCIDETGDDLSLSTARDSSETARDFWIAYTASCLTKSDIILLTGQNDVLMDAVCFSATGSEWSNKVMAYSLLAYESGIWTDGTSSSAASSSVCATGVRTLARQNLADVAALYTGAAAVPVVIPVYAADWCVVVKGSPGSWNTAGVYTR